MISDEPIKPAAQAFVTAAENYLREYSDHATALGKIAIEWNKLQLNFGKLFARLIMPHDYVVAMAIWHAVLNDRSQRAMLDAAAKATRGDKSDIAKDVSWATGNANALENDRNTALHAPYGLAIENGKFVMKPDSFTGHGRAKLLDGKDLAKELQSYEKNISAISLFVKEMAYCLSIPEDIDSWPRRPRLPRAAQGTTRKKPRRQSGNK